MGLAMVLVAIVRELRLRGDVVGDCLASAQKTRPPQAYDMVILISGLPRAWEEWSC